MSNGSDRSCILKATILQSNFAKVYASSTIKLLI